MAPTLNAATFAVNDYWFGFTDPLHRQNILMSRMMYVFGSHIKIRNNSFSSQHKETGDDTSP